MKYAEILNKIKMLVKQDDFTIDGNYVSINTIKKIVDSYKKNINSIFDMKDYKRMINDEILDKIYDGCIYKSVNDGNIVKNMKIKRINNIYKIMIVFYNNKKLILSNTERDYNFYYENLFSCNLDERIIELVSYCLNKNDILSHLEKFENIYKLYDNLIKKKGLSKSEIIEPYFFISLLNKDSNSINISDSHFNYELLFDKDMEIYWDFLFDSDSYYFINKKYIKGKPLKNILDEGRNVLERKIKLPINKLPEMLKILVGDYNEKINEINNNRNYLLVKEISK